MVERKSGHIINVGSVAGDESFPKSSIYCGSKFFVRAIHSTLLQELVATPLRVSLICPGYVKTDFFVSKHDGDEKKAQDTLRGFQPLAGEDIADHICYVASRPSHVNVAKITVYPLNQANGGKLHRSE